MAININISRNLDESNANEGVYKVLSDQSPLDFAVSYLEKIEDLFSFYKQFNLKTYYDFYNNSKYRIQNFENPMKLNNYISATKSEDSGDFNSDFNYDFLS